MTRQSNEGWGRAGTGRGTRQDKGEVPRYCIICKNILHTNSPPLSLYLGLSWTILIKICLAWLQSDLNKVTLFVALFNVQCRMGRVVWGRMGCVGWCEVFRGVEGGKDGGPLHFPSC
jgi:hypothetical protein